MKVISEKEVGRTKRLVVELQPGEKLVAIYPDSFYKMGEPHDDIVRGDHIIDADQVSWCVVEQRWAK
jgi:hypothetical protein